MNNSLIYYILRKKYYQNYYITYFILLTHVIKNSFFFVSGTKGRGFKSYKSQLVYVFHLFMISTIILIINNIIICNTFISISIFNY